MDLLRAFSNIEVALISLFIISYMIYMFRLYRINKHIKVDTQSVLIKFIVRSIYFSLMIIMIFGDMLIMISQQEVEYGLS